MKSIEESLEVLGLKPGASWQQINEAYRDLVRVWHPDRFQGDARLRTRAEAQTRLLNEAMERLRGGYDPKKSAARPSAEPKPAPSSPRPQAPPSSARSEKQTTPASFVVRGKPLALLGRVALGMAFAVFAYLAIEHGEPHPYKAAFGSFIGLFALHGIVRNAVGLVARRPAVWVDTKGLVYYDAGKLAWADLHRVWAFVEARSPALAVECSSDYLKRQRILRSTLLRLRHAFRSAHIIIHFGGLDSHPTEVVTLLNSLIDSGRTLPSPPPAKPPALGSGWARFVALSAAGVLLVRTVLEEELPWLEISIYLAIFAVGWAIDTWRRFCQMPVGAR